MIEDKEKRTFKLETARLSNARLTAARAGQRKACNARPALTREIVIRLIEAIRKM